ncbi:MAG: homocysteine S-methyltransferase family protein, partial [Firmicutes bacterium]|nr:homocysteine S-methyltransferase family protein [Bacillota bacterium]
MSFIERIGKELLLFDGAMGTMLQAKGLPAGVTPDLANMVCPEKVREVHGAYLDAGADLLKTNTFGTNSRKLAGSGYTVEAVVSQAVRLARGAGNNHFVALDIGPSGKLLAPLGDLDFGDAYKLFAEVARAGTEAGADCILVETMSDTYELKAAVLAARETGLPVLATVTADASGKLLTGADMDTVCALLEGLGVHALGLNCGFGPEALLVSLSRLAAVASLPLILNANAGLPRQAGEQTVFDETPEAFADAMARAVSMGASLLGGCCGTTPAHIRAMAEAVRGLSPKPITPNRDTVVCSGSRAVRIGGCAPVLIGERVNPTGKPAMKRALREGSTEYMLREAVRQQDAGAHILDVNAGLPGIDEAAWLSRLTQAIQAVSDLPLQLDTASPAALEEALFRYNGKAMINSVNGKRESMDAVFPLVRKYGGVVVALTLDEEGIPATARGRVAIARRIVEEAGRYGIDRRNLVIDPLTLAVSAESDAAAVTLEALSRIRDELGIPTVLGVSNISFGLPQRGALNAAFFTLAVGAGLSAAILNPFSGDAMAAYHAARALLGKDPGCAGYIAAMAGAAEAQADKPARQAGVSLRQAIERGLRDEARA